MTPSLYFLLFQYRDSEQVVIEDRMEKEALRRKLEKEHMERDAATKVIIKHSLINHLHLPSKETNHIQWQCSV